MSDARMTMDTSAGDDGPAGAQDRTPPTGPGLDAIVDVAEGVLSDLDVDSVLDRVLNAARGLTGARYAAVGVLAESRRELARFITLGVDDTTGREIGPPPTGHGVLGEVIRNPVPLRLADVGAHPRSYGFPPGHPRMSTFLGVPVPVAGEPFGNLYVTDKEGGAQFTETDEQALCTLARFAGVAIDHARRYGGAESQRRQLARTNEALRAAADIARALGGETELAPVLELVAKRGRALVSARTVVIELLDGDELVTAAAAGELPPSLLEQRMPLAESVADAALRIGRTQRLEEELNRSRFVQHGLGRLGLQAQAGLVVPMVFRNQPHGVLLAVDRLSGGPSFDADDQRLLESFAASAATAVHTARTVAGDLRSQRMAAAEQERTRWARDLHDETLQGLAALRLSLRAAQRSDDAAAVDAALDDAVEYLGTEIGNLRALISDLRPPALDQFGVGPAIKGLAERASRGGLHVDVDVDLAYETGRLPTRLTAEIETALYRIVQEALTNAVRHGEAKRAVVEIGEDGGTVRLAVRDDGIGFDPSQQSGGFGLVGMAERAALVDGTFEVTSGTPAGTELTATFPATHRRGGDPPPALRERTAG